MSLPSPTTSFVARPGRLAEAVEQLRHGPLVTFAGPGGLGKTRLAVRAAAAVADSFSDGVRFVDLTPIEDPAFVPSAVANAFDVREEPGRPLAETLFEALEGCLALLVLDNCEHVVSACASLVRGITTSGNGVHVLSTSREVLGLPGELVYHVPLLDVPPEIAYIMAEDIAEVESVRLFVERARLADPRFRLTDANAEAIADICRKVEGLPLAVELAAARARTHEPDYLAALLGDHLDALDVEDTRASPRHRTLRATIDWSYALLTATEQAVLRRLSVFTGGWTLEAAEAALGNDECRMMNDELKNQSGSKGSPSDIHHQSRSAFIILHSEVLQHLSSLVDKSLVEVDERGSEVRYRMLETVRAYAREQLAYAGEENALRRSHRDWYLAKAEHIRARATRGETRLYEHLDPEHDNFRSALRWTLGNDGDADEALRLVAALYPYWNLRGLYMEGLRWAEEAFEAAAARPELVRPASRAGALHGKALLTLVLRDTAVAAAAIEECVTIRRGLDDPRGLALALNMWSMTLDGLGQGARALEIQQESLALAREVEDDNLVSLALATLGIMTMGLAEVATARAYFDEALVGYQGVGNDMMIAVTNFNLGMLAWADGDGDLATRLLDTSLTMARAQGYKRLVADALAYLGRVRAEERDFPSAIPLLEEAMKMQRAMGNPEGIFEVLESYALALVAAGVARKAVVLFDATTALRAQSDMERSVLIARTLERRIAPIYTTLPEDERLQASSRARRVSLDEAIALAMDSGRLLPSRRTGRRPV